MTMPDLFEQLDSPAENGDDWIRRLLSEPDETPSPLPASDDTSPSDDLDDMHQDAIPGFGTDMDADEPARSVHAGRIVLTVLAVVRTDK